MRAQSDMSAADSSARTALIRAQANRAVIVLLALSVLAIALGFAIWLVLSGDAKRQAQVAPRQLQPPYLRPLPSGQTCLSLHPLLIETAALLPPISAFFGKKKFWSATELLKSPQGTISTKRLTPSSKGRGATSGNLSEE